MISPLLTLRRAVNRLPASRDTIAAHAFIDHLERSEAARAGTPGATHYPGCYREHHECAVARVQELAGLLDEIEELAMGAADRAWFKDRIEAVRSTLGDAP